MGSILDAYLVDANVIPVDPRPKSHDTQIDGIEIDIPAYRGMMGRGVAILPHESPYVPLAKPMYSVADLH